MRRINMDVLQPSDIVLTTSEAKVSKVIRGVTFTDVSHAMLCVSRGSVIDSTGEGVQARNVQKIIYPDSCAIHVLRLKDPPSAPVLKQVVEYMRTAIGTPYSVREALAAQAGIGKGSSRQFCSRLVARAYAAAGLKLVRNPNFCTPAQLKRSKLLFALRNAWVQVDDEEVSALEWQGDKTKDMRAITNDLLARARRVVPGIQSINDLTRAAIDAPEHDESLAAALSDSGYLSFWRTQIEQFPWRYDALLIVQLFHSIDEKRVLIDYCRKTVEDEELGVFDHWKKTLVALSQMCDLFDRKTLSVQRDTYLKMCFYHNLRVKAAQVLLNGYADC